MNPHNRLIAGWLVGIRGVAREGAWGRRPPQDFEKKNMVGCLSLRGNEREEEDENDIL